MSRATPQMQELAGRLIAHETSQNKSSKTLTPATFFVTEKLRPHLTMLMGSVGFHALLTRALMLTTTEFAWLSAVHAIADGTYEGLDTLEAKVEPQEIAKARVMLLAQLLGLLVAFIGESLTVQLLHEIWPKLTLNYLNLSTGR